MKKMMFGVVVLLATVMSGCGVTSSVNGPSQDHSVAAKTIQSASSARASAQKTGNMKKVELSLQPSEACCPTLSGTDMKEMITKFPGVTKVVLGKMGRSPFGIKQAKPIQKRLRIIFIG